VTQLLNLLDLRGTVVTADAMNTQKEPPESGNTSRVLLSTEERK
jgi:predicted transposase YbfD/YdcC